MRSVAQVRDKKESSYEIFKQLLKDEGLGGLYNGVSFMITVLGCSNFVYFYFNALLKTAYLIRLNAFRKTRKLAPKTNADINNFINLGFATVSGIVNVLITTPLWVVATRLAMNSKKNVSTQKDAPVQPLKSIEPAKGKHDRVIKKRTSDDVSHVIPTGFIQGLIRIGKTEGIGALWSGTAASLLLVSNPAIQFSSYEKLKQLAFKYVFSSPANSLQYFLLGAVSKMIATILTYPLQLSQTRLRMYSRNHDSDETSNIPRTTTQCLAKIYKKEGFPGWFKGMDAKLLQTCLTSAFMFSFYENFFAFSRKIILSKSEL